MGGHFLSYIVTNILVLNSLWCSRIFLFCSSILQFQCWKTETLCIVIACANDVICLCFDVKSAEKRYACLKSANNKTKLKMTCVSSHRCLGSPVVRKKEFWLKGFISLAEINLSRQKQNYQFYLQWFCYLHILHLLRISFYFSKSQGVPGCNNIADLSLKIVFWTHKFAVGTHWYWKQRVPGPISPKL